MHVITSTLRGYLHEIYHFKNSKSSKSEVSRHQEALATKSQFYYWIYSPSVGSHVCKNTKCDTLCIIELMGVPEIALLWQLIALQCCIRPSYRQSICWKRTLMKVTISFTLMRSIIELQGILQELRASDLSKVYGDCFTDLIYISAVLEWLHYVWTNNSCIDILPAAEQIWPVVCMLQRTPFPHY